MPIYEFACSKCRVIFSFLCKTTCPDRSPVCPKCGNKAMEKKLSGFSCLKGVAEPPSSGNGHAAADADNVDERRLMRTMSELERDMEHLDENNPKHMAHLMRKMKESLPPGTMPKELDTAIKRLEAGESPEEIEEDMGDVLGDMDGRCKSGLRAGAYTRDSKLYPY